MYGPAGVLGGPRGPRRTTVIFVFQSQDSGLEGKQNYLVSQRNIHLVLCSTVEPLVATASRERPPLLSNQFSKIPKVSTSASVTT